MSYTRAFFDLNVKFAQKVARVGQIPLAAALLDYTHLYRAFGLGRGFDATHPTWHAYLEGAQAAPDITNWTQHYYQACQAGRPPKTAEPEFGCFYYALWPGNRVRLHFVNREPGDCSPLAANRAEARRAELARMFAHLKPLVGEAATVLGAAWLYNLDAYRRLFPPGFLATARASDGEHPYLALWGQFLDRHGNVRPDLAERFLECLDRQATLPGVTRCFPFPVLRLESPIAEFYPFFGV